ncbi:MAG: glucose-6-phosphate isomerase [Planctomycetes bacterium]|nr:glucose-6-phosphate isomerase [Planctomycetota bacterium]
MNAVDLWKRYCKYHCDCPTVGLQLDISRMRFSESLMTDIVVPMSKAFDTMDQLEGGAIANPDEDRMVGHYWLRDAKRAPGPTMSQAIESAVDDIKAFARDVHTGIVRPSKGGRFTHVLQIGIGGSALGPQFVNEALRGSDDPMRIAFLDNTDPDGIDRVLSDLSPHLSQTLCLVVSKSGGTKETRNSMLEVTHAFKRLGLNFSEQAVAITGEGSALHKVSQSDTWLKSFPMWDWVGGRTSQMSAVGLLPAALTGFDIDALLAGARDMDTCTRVHDVSTNPAAILAATWFDAAKTRNLRDMVVIPYKDRLSLLSRYLQQLIMESLGKDVDVHGKLVEEGIAVYGNKGSTDQHAYVQQLRDGYNNFYVTFVDVMRDRSDESIDVDKNVKTGDYLAGFLLGTRDALYEKDRESITIRIDEVNAHRVGALIGLYERAVGLYASLAGINAYHQPGVEAGKKAAGEVLEVQRAILSYLADHPNASYSAEQLAEAIGEPDQAERVNHILHRLAYNSGRGVSVERGQSIADARFSAG